MTSTHVPPTKSISIDGLDQIEFNFQYDNGQENFVFAPSVSTKTVEQQQKCANKNLSAVTLKLAGQKDTSIPLTKSRLKTISIDGLDQMEFEFQYDGDQMVRVVSSKSL